ncbi:uncharacterized protein LOC101896082 [Musca domestica]|uniref:Uncharacterized protein LOC101896082 n=1 Tax=Musca domestica TaxID=7370 RepID=A0A1I8M5E7_MUSDO|nr:uncharacterized protein LOC101896082 [Musca domestica]
MFKFMTICLFALLALASAKPHLLTTGVSYATPVVAPVHAVAAPVAFATPVVASSAYYPAYTSSYYHPAYATYPHLGATYFVRR